MSLNTKTKQLVSYIVKNYSRTSVTSLMKLAYIIDLISVQRSKNKISSFEYSRYHYGPFDKEIYRYIECLVKEGVVKPKTEYASFGDEYIVYDFSEKSEPEFNELSEKEVSLVDEVLTSLKGLGAKTLTQITYKTKPMQALGATLGGDESMGEVLDMKSNESRD